MAVVGELQLKNAAATGHGLLAAGQKIADPQLEVVIEERHVIHGVTPTVVFRQQMHHLTLAFAGAGHPAGETILRSDGRGVGIFGFDDVNLALLFRVEGVTIIDKPMVTPLGSHVDA